MGFLLIGSAEDGLCLLAGCFSCRDWHPVIGGCLPRAQCFGCWHRTLYNPNCIKAVTVNIQWWIWKKNKSFSFSVRFPPVLQVARFRSLAEYFSVVLCPVVFFYTGLQKVNPLKYCVRLNVRANHNVVRFEWLGVEMWFMRGNGVPGPHGFSFWISLG